MMYTLVDLLAGPAARRLGRGGHDWADEQLPWGDDAAAAAATASASTAASASSSRPPARDGFDTFQLEDPALRVQQGAVFMGAPHGRPIMGWRADWLMRAEVKGWH